MFFMNYSGLENTSSKLLKYAMDLENVQRTMYASTKEKLETSIKNCEESLEIMKSFLEQHKDDNTSGGSGRNRRAYGQQDQDELDKRYVTKDEFNEKMDEVNDKIDDILDKLGQLLDKSVSAVSDAVDTVKCTIVPDEYDPKFASNESKPYIDTSKHSKKSEIKKRKNDLRKLMRSDHQLLNNVVGEIRSAVNFHEVIECSELIEYWFNHRFHPDHYPSKGFRAENIPHYTEYIAGAYAYYWSQGACELRKFVDEFKQWCDEISQPGVKNPYVLPSSVGHIKYTSEWIKDHTSWEKDEYRWITLTCALSSALYTASGSYSKFLTNNDFLDDLGSVMDNYRSEGGEFEGDKEFSHAVSLGLSCGANSIEKLLMNGPKVFSIEGISADASDDLNRYNYLDKEICFA